MIAAHRRTARQIDALDQNLARNRPSHVEALADLLRCEQETVGVFEVKIHGFDSSS